MSTTSDKIQAIEEMCIDIFAHSQNDYEVTLSGNGVNCAEASLTALAVLDILYGDGRKWKSDNSQKIAKKSAELRKLYGEEV